MQATLGPIPRSQTSVILQRAGLAEESLGPGSEDTDDTHDGLKSVFGDGHTPQLGLIFAVDKYIYRALSQHESRRCGSP